MNITIDEHSPIEDVPVEAAESRSIRRWTGEEETRLLARAAEGVDVKSLSAEFGRSGGAVRLKLTRLRA
jgi:hypothetical protein